MNEPSSFRPFIVPAIIMSLGGWAGLYYFMNFELPTLWPRWAFFALVVIALTGTALPVIWFLDRWLTSARAAHVDVRRSIWVGVFGAVLAWLQLGRILTFMLAVWLGIGIVVIEYLVTLRERAQQKPTPKPFARSTDPEE